MDTENLIAYSKARFEHVANRKLLQEKYQAKMLFVHAGGMWQAGPELLTTLLACPDTEVVLLDMYGIPVKVQTRELHRMAQQRWQEQMTAWLLEHEQLSKNR